MSPVRKIPFCNEFSRVFKQICDVMLAGGFEIKITQPVIRILGQNAKSISIMKNLF